MPDDALAGLLHNAQDFRTGRDCGKGMLTP